jgi:hypothetical protein
MSYNHPVFIASFLALFVVFAARSARYILIAHSLSVRGQRIGLRVSGLLAAAIAIAFPLLSILPQDVVAWLRFVVLAAVAVTWANTSFWQKRASRTQA